MGEALDAAERAFAIVDANGGIETDELFTRLVHSEALDAAGRRDDARRALAAARDKLDASARRFVDEDGRCTYLTRVPEHARILELAQAWRLDGPIPDPV